MELPIGAGTTILFPEFWKESRRDADLETIGIGVMAKPWVQMRHLGRDEDRTQNLDQSNL